MGWNNTLGLVWSRRADRVPRAQAAARAGVRWTLAFAGAAVAAALLVDEWTALHLLLAGGLVSAVSGVSMMLTITWSSAPAPPTGLLGAQRWAVAAGAAGVVTGRRVHRLDWLVVPSAALYLAGLVALAVLLVQVARRGSERRYDPAVAAYVAAVACGSAGSVIGTMMATDGVTAHGREAHITLNLLGLVGLSVWGTLPYFAATVGRSRMNEHATRTLLGAGIALQLVATATTAAALAADARALAAAGLAAYAAGVIGVLALLPRPTRRQWRWAGPRLVALWAGSLWWVVALGAAAADALGGRLVWHGTWMRVLAVGGFAQILWGSLAYLLPVLRGGGPEALSRGFAATRSWPALVAVNAAALCFAFDLDSAAAVAVGVWIVDAAWRVVRVGLSRPRAPG